MNIHALLAPAHIHELARVLGELLTASHNTATVSIEERDPRPLSSLTSADLFVLYLIEELDNGFYSHSISMSDDGAPMPGLLSAVCVQLVIRVLGFQEQIDQMTIFTSNLGRPRVRFQLDPESQVHYLTRGVPTDNSPAELDEIALQSMQHAAALELDVVSVPEEELEEFLGDVEEKPDLAAVLEKFRERIRGDG